MQIASPIQISQPNQSTQQGQGGILQNMRPGQSVTVEVVSAEPGILTVKTADGQTLRAEFPGATVMAPGDKLELALLSNGKDVNPQFQLRQVNGQNVGISTTDMQAKMIDLGVEPSELNVKSAEFLAERGVQPTPERLAILTKLASYYPKMPASAALFVAANGIPVTRPNMNALMDWLQGGGMVGDKANELAEAVRQIASGLQSAQTTDKPAQAVIQQAAQQPLSAQQSQAADQAQLPQTSNLQQQGAAQPAGQQPEQQPQIQTSQQQTVNQPQNAGAFIQNFVGEVEKSPNFPAKTIPAQAVDNIANTLSNTPASEAPKIIESFLNNYPALNPEQKAAAAQTLLSAYDTARQDNAQNVNPQQTVQNTNAASENIQPAVKPADGSQPAKFAAAQTELNSAEGGISVNPQNEAVRANNVHPEKGAQQTQPQKAAETTVNIQNDTLQNSTISHKNEPQDTLKTDITITGNAKNTQSIKPESDENIQKAQQSELSPYAAAEQDAPDVEIGKVLKQLSSLVAAMKDDAAADAETLQEAVKNQQHAAEAIKSGISKVTGEQSPLTQKAADLSAKVQLGSQLDNFYYCQIPFQVNEHSNTAELYVFKRKNKGAAADKTNTTILIALETQRMGRVETVLKAEDMALNIEFRVESSQVQKYIQKEAAELKKQLEDSEFKVMDVKVTRIEIPATPLNVDQVLGEKQEFKLKTIDISV